jgi:predicted transcriptional regulator
MLYGLRGVGKTVLLNRIRLDAESRGMACARIESPEDRSLPSLLAPALRATLIRLSRGEAVRTGWHKAMKALAGFVNALKVKYLDIEIGLEFEPEAGLADSGDLDTDLADLLASVALAAQEKNSAVVLFVDELQYVEQNQLAALIMALHTTSQSQLPITMMGAGLPQLIGQSGRAKSYAERLFEFVHVDRLDEEAARAALCVPAEREGVTLEEAAIEEIIRRTSGYPYFIQEWGKHSWNVAGSSPIRLQDAETASDRALAELDEGFFRVRFDRLSPAEKRYLRAMAELGPGPHRSGEVAEELGRKVTSVAPTRSALISKGMIYSPAHGDTAFTVPLFDGFMKRIMP